MHDDSLLSLSFNAIKCLLNRWDRPSAEYINMKANGVEFWLHWLSQTMMAWALAESRFISYRLFRVSSQNKQSYCIMEPGMWNLWSLCERAAAVAVGMCLYWQRWCEPDDRNHVNALIVMRIINIRAITAAIRLLGYKTVLFTCLWLERELINGNCITSTKKQPVSFLFYFILKKQFTLIWKDAEKMLIFRQSKM